MTSQNSPARWPRLLTVRAAAEYLGVGIFSVRQYGWEGLLKPVPMPGSNIKDEKGRIIAKPGDRQMRKIFLDREDLDAFVEQLKEQS